MSNSKIFIGFIISIIICLAALAGSVGKLLRITRFITENSATTTECLVGKLYYKDLNYDDGYNPKDAPLEVWDF